MLKKHRLFFVLALAVSLLAGCAATGSSSSNGKDALSIYEVHEDGRIYVFYDKKEFDLFKQVGETPFRLTRIGAGPKGETLVFGLTKADKKKPDQVAAIQLFDGKIKADEQFYAEMYKNGRIYVFNNFEDMNTVRSFGHPNYFYMSVGSGPKGETVVYVLNGKNKKKKPLGLIEMFKSNNA